MRRLVLGRSFRRASASEFWCAVWQSKVACGWTLPGDEQLGRVWGVGADTGTWLRWRVARNVARDGACTMQPHTPSTLSPETPLLGSPPYHHSVPPLVLLYACRQVPPGEGGVPGRPAGAPHCPTPQHLPLPRQLSSAGSLPERRTALRLPPLGQLCHHCTV